MGLGFSKLENTETKVVDSTGEVNNNVVVQQEAPFDIHSNDCSRGNNLLDKNY
jgi:hypothetical protein